MNTDYMSRAQELFQSAIALPANQRADFLRESAGDDANLRDEVESLLQHDQQATAAFMQTPDAPTLTQKMANLDATDNAGPDVDDQESPFDLSIEGYKITKELSRGGQGVVYQAIQDATRRDVAIKLLHDGAHASRATRRRFEREIELVAQLSHPNIISIFHSGRTADRRQFYVMDYVDGKPLDRYVRNSDLSLEDVLALIATICDAVQYAHGKGVIHRDLKPSNVLVAADGTPKILDFGLAKPLAATAESLISINQEIVGTLPYMSPEQAGGGPGAIDTRTDVYSLGVMLYELLTGQKPYPMGGFLTDVLRHIAETQPTPASRSWTRAAGVTHRAVRRMHVGECPIDGEVEAIVYKALAKERQWRYQSAGELARDIRHYLSGEPIEAKGDVLAYVLWKQTRRLFRQAPVAALLALCALLAPGFVVAVMFWRQASQERDVANAAISFLNNDVFQSIDPERSGRDVDVIDLLDAASARIEDRFADAPLQEASIRQTLGNFYGSLGENDEALGHLERTLKLRREKLGDRHLDVAETLVSLSRIYENTGRGVEAEDCLREALAIRERLLGRNDPMVADTVRQLAAFAGRQGNLELESILAARTGASDKVNRKPSEGGIPTRADDWRKSLDEQLARARRTHGDSHPEVARSLTELADRLSSAGNLTEAEPFYEEALSIWTEQLGAEHLRAREAFTKLEDTLSRLGKTEKMAPILEGRLDRALARGDNAMLLSAASWDVVKRPGYSADLYAKALEAATRACAMQPDNGAYQNTKGVAGYRAGLFERAHATLTHADKLNDGHPADVAFLAMSLARLGRTDEARQELELLRKMMRKDPWSTDAQSLLFLHEAESLEEFK